MMNIRHKKKYLLVVSAFLMLFCYGCTITMGKVRFGYKTNGASLSTDLKTVSIPQFTNRATLIEPGLAQKLTDKLKDKILAQTNLQIVRGIGDVNFEGAIEMYGTSPMSVSGSSTNTVALQTRLTIGVKVKYSNQKEPLMDFESSFSKYKDYDYQLTLSAAEGQYQEKLLDDLVDDIFNKAFVNW